MDTSGECPIRMMVVYDEQDGFYLALVPFVVSEVRLEAALRELGVEAKAVFELGAWRQTHDNVAVAFLLAPGGE